MRRPLKSLLLIVAGVVIGFPLFSLTYYTMVRTSTPYFCSSCHEIRSAYNTWLTSSHVNNRSGTVTDCMDCHLPAPQDTINFFYSKTLHGVKDIFVHVIKGSDNYDREKARKVAYKSIKNEQCLKCHRNILFIPDKRGAMLAHRSVLFPRKGYEKRCTDCHNNLVHNERNVYGYRR